MPLTYYKLNDKLISLPILTSMISFAEQVTVQERHGWGKRALVISRKIIVLLEKEQIQFPFSDSFLKYQ